MVTLRNLRAQDRKRQFRVDVGFYLNGSTPNMQDTLDSFGIHLPASN